MNYYLKYRPQKIAELDLVGVRDDLIRVLSAKNPPHAWLFAGPKGTGKTSSARIVAKSLNCGQKRTGPEPCNRCDHCRAITRGTAVDVLEIDAASNRGIDDIRELRDKIRLAPTELKYKVYIIDEAHMLTKEAFNALLKTLEEPPEFAVFILCTTEAEKLPGTIVSRCVEIGFTKAAAGELERALTRVIKGEKLKVSRRRLTEIAAAADGSFRDAVKLLEHPLKSRDFRLDNWLVLVFQGKSREALARLQQAWAEGHEPKQLLLLAVDRLRGLLLKRLGAGAAEDIAGIDDPVRLKQLLERLLVAGEETKSAVIETLPLELAVAEWGQKTVPPPGPPGPEPAAVPVSGEENTGPVDRTVSARWPAVLEAVKPLNHSLEALLKATEPVRFDRGFLHIRVFYRFHKERLEEERYRKLVEQAAAKVWLNPVKIKFFLARKHEDNDIIKTAEKIFGISPGGD